MCDVVHTSEHKQYISDPNRDPLTKPFAVNEGLFFEEHLIQTLDRMIKQLRIKQIPLVKVHWANYTSSEAT